MGILEIVLLAAGAVIFIASFCIPVKKEKLKEETRNLAAEEVKSLVADELDVVRNRLTELSEEEMQEQIAKSERSMERISNEKIMAVNEYSDTVLEEIHENHEEVVFLYDMLKHKKESLSESYDKTDKRLQELFQQIKDSEITVKEKLEELTEKYKEFEKKRAEFEAPVYAAAEPKKPLPENKKKETEAVAQILTQKVKEVQTPAFQPIVPEKVEAVPKKAQIKKTVKTAKEGAAPEKKAALAAGNADVMLMMSGSMEQNAAANSNERILALHTAGKSNMAIAKELGLGIGEVKLVIDLYEELH